MILRPWDDSDLDAWSRLADGGDSSRSTAPALLSQLRQAAHAWERNRRGPLACELLDCDDIPADAVPDHRPDLRGPVGSVELHPAPATLNDALSHQIQVRFLPVLWGRGYAHEATSAVLSWGFGDDQIDRIGAMIEIGNDRAVTLARRLGMTAGFRTIDADSGQWSDAYLLDAAKWAISASAKSPDETTPVDGRSRA